MLSVYRATVRTISRLLLIAVVCLIAFLGVGCKYDRFRAVWAMGFQADYEGIMEVHRIAGETAGQPERIEGIDDLWLQSECIDVLEALATDEAVEALLAIVEQNAAIDDSSFNAIPVLAAIPTHKPFVLERLFEFCNSESAPIRYAGAAGLGAWGLGLDDRALDQLCRMVNDSKYLVRSRALESLGLIGKRRVDAADQAMGCILSCATESNVSVRISVAEALGNLGIPDTIGLLEQMLEDPNFQVRESAIKALGGFGEERALPHLKEFARNKSDMLRAAAVEALTKHDCRKAVEVLTELADDPSEDVRKMLARRLKPIDPFIDGVLLKLLRDPLPTVRRLAIVTLGNTRRMEAREAAFSMLADLDPKVRKEGVQALNEQLFSGDELKQLLSSAATDDDPGPRIAAASRLKHVSIEGGEQLLVKLANDRDLYVRRQAYRALYKVNPDRLREIVQP